MHWLNLVSGVLTRYWMVESSLKLSCIHFFFELNFCAANTLLFQVAHSFLTALQNDERTNYQLDVKFQESYLKKVVALLQCQLSEGAVIIDGNEAAIVNKTDVHSVDDIEEGELLNSHGLFGSKSFSVISCLCTNVS